MNGIKSISEEKGLKNLLSEDVWHLLKECKAYIAGGAITSLFTGNEVNDVDVYFRSEESLVEALSNIFGEDDEAIANAGFSGKHVHLKP